METKFTKGKWGMHKHGTACISVGDRIVANCGGYSNNYDFENVQEENEANAKLCCAAPELLNRLESLVLSVKCHPDYVSGEEGDEWHDLISLAEDEINKAI